MQRAAVLLYVLLAFPAAYLIRLLVVWAAGSRWPRAAAAAERWWAWLPLLGAAILLIWANPIVGVIATAAIAIVMTRADSLGSPFRPRR